VQLKKEHKVIIVSCIFISLFFIFYFSLGKSNQHNPTVMIGKKLPIISGNSLENNKKINLNSKLKNEFFLINIFASWCAPCMEEHKHLMDLKSFKIKIVGINYKDSEQNAKQFLRKLKDPYFEVIKDYSGKLSIELGAYGVPETYIIDKNHNIISKHIGPINEKFVKEIRELKK